MVPQVIGIVKTCVVLVLHLRQSGIVLLSARHAGIVIGQASTVLLCQRHHAVTKAALRLRPVTFKQFAQMFLAEVSRVVQYNVNDYLHAPLMDSIDKRLQRDVLALIATIYPTEIHSVVAVIVVARGVLHHRSYPDGGKAQRLDVVQFLNESFEVAAPRWVAGITFAVVPALGVVLRVAVIETCGQQEIYCLVAEIGPFAPKCLGSDRQQQQHKET